MADTLSKHVLITGSDDYEVARRARALIDANPPEDPMNLEAIDGTGDTVDAAVAAVDRIRGALLIMPFFGGRKVIWVKNASFLQDNIVGRSETVKAALSALSDNLQAISAKDALLIMAAPRADRRKAFIKGFEKWGQVEVFDLPDIQNARSEAAWVREVAARLKRAGLDCEDGVAEILVESVGNQTRVLEAEIEKLSLYAHPRGVVSIEDLRRIVSVNRSLMIWDLNDAVTEGNSVEAVPLLRQLLAQGESEVGIMILLSGQVRLAAISVWLKEQGMLRLEQRGAFVNAHVSPEGEALLPANKSGVKPKGFRLAKTVAAASKKESARWFRALDICYQSHLQLLSGGGDRHRALETAVLQLCGV